MDDDISIDFGKIVSLFKGKKDKKSKKKKAAKVQKSNEDDDLSFDWNKVLPFVKKYSVYLLLLIPIIFSFYLRTVPNRLPITEDFARSSIYNQIRDNIGNEINKQYPYLPADNKQALIDENFNQIFESQREGIEQAVKQNADIIKSHFKDDKGYTYLGDIDSYFWLRYAENIYDHGYMGDEKRDGVEYDNHMLAPLGMNVPSNFYPYFEAFLYTVLIIFNPGITFMQTAFYAPLALSIIAIIAAFLIGKKIAGNLGGFFAGMMTAVHPTILSRSLGSDNDIVNIVFPLLVLLFFLIALEAKSRIKKFIFISISGIFVGIYSFAWSGYWHVFYFLIGTLGLYFIYLIVYDYKETLKNPLSALRKEESVNLIIMGFLFILSSTIMLVLLHGASEFTNLPYKPIKIIRLKEAAHAEQLWPNVYTTVAELNEAALPDIINSIGGEIFFLLALIGIILTLIDTEKDLTFGLGYTAFSVVFFALLINAGQSIRLLFFLVLMSLPIFLGVFMSIIKRYKVDIKYALVLYMWFAATIYASTKGIRFALLTVPAFIVALSLFIGKAYKIVNKMLSQSLNIGELTSKVVIILVLLLILVQPTRSGYQTAKSYMPHVNDAWVSSLQKIKTNSSQDAIINSWWDFGHWFKYLADRAVTFDGASQNMPNAHWIGKALLSDDEEQAMDILRMLDCGSNSAFEILNTEQHDTLQSVSIIYKIISMRRADAKKELLKYVPEKTAERILEKTHCKPPEDYFITSEDMVGKSGVWAHFGSWSFERARIYYYYTEKSQTEFVDALVTEFSYSTDDAQRTYYELQSLQTDREVNDWIAPWPSYGGQIGCSVNEDLLQCNMRVADNQYMPLTVNLTTMEVYVNAQDKKIYPNSVGYLKGEEYVVKEYNEDLLGYSFVLINESNSYKVILMAPELVGSMFTRLFFLEGTGLDHFEKFNDVTDISGQRIITWKINWEGI
ncbi:hypothetical protein JW930_06320 [Candidatus Woesearchaeota archaeon]|nr:hypothetical protein [Candidatus Woesearchaeota archaeon]